jgi:hypothetical protein
MANEMTHETATLPAQAHHPLRRLAGFALAFGLVAGPLAWGVHLVANYALASHACFPGAVPRAALPPGSDWLLPLLIAIDLTVIAIAAVAALLSYRSWRSERQELSRNAGEVVDIGEGRTRFLSLWGMLTSVGFLIAIVFDVVALWVPPCG